ncbi:MAG: hypothetical protein PVH82_16320 [Desulfobacteraceae bacterium]
MKERTKLLFIALTFLAAYHIPWGNSTIRQSGLEAFMMLQEYAREHVLTCLIPAFFIAGTTLSRTCPLASKYAGNRWRHGS